jgi:hypothetical protein
MLRASYIIIGALALWITISSCGPAGKLRRANRLIDQAVAAGATVKTDTVFVTKTVIVPETHFDTVLTRVNLTDTITVEKDKVITKVKINTVTKEVFVSTKCPERIKEVKVPVQVFKTISAGYTKWRVTWMTGLGWLIGFIMGTFLGRFVLKLIV